MGFTALRRLDKRTSRTSLRAVYDATPAEAMWIAASENLKHGLPLGGEARRTVFKRFVTAGREPKS